MIRYIVLALLLVATPAMARPTAQQQQAKQLYDAGTQHYNLGEYEAAIASYKEAYRVVPNPYFLYNIAQSYRLAGDLRQALSFYKSFLNALPDAPNQDEVETRIAELEDAVRKQEASPTGPVSPDGPAKPVAKPRPLPTPVEAVARLPQRPAPAPTPLTVDTQQQGSRPVYKRWWFWVGVGVVAAGASTMAVMSGDDGAPASDLGNFPVF